ncbi:MAG: FtsQ-type POTRA domain-containing protein [Methylacidiphilales bacterium]|nr:FtsQ-type POTRA domain-containing protein [Candidatus Methylacidiphilales bacterium]
MSRRQRNRTRQKQINILHTTTRKRHTRKQLVQILGWSSLVAIMLAAVGIGLHFGISLLLDQVLYSNSRYALDKIEIEPRGHFSERLIRQATGLEMKQNLWTLDLPKITSDLEKLPYVSNARVERHFPDKISIHIQERIPVVKIVGLNNDLNTKETFYLDRDGIVLKPRSDEDTPLLPEIIGLTNADLEPGTKLEQTSLARALQILDAIDHTELHTTIDIRTIDLSQPLSITMVTTRDMSITFRLDCIDQQLFRLQTIFRYPDFQYRAIRTVDLTPDRNVPITFYE